jgi:hypothetical protein
MREKVEGLIGDPDTNNFFEERHLSVVEYV